MNQQKLSNIFIKKPEQWGFRGDPFFWEDLKQYFDTIDMPYDEWELTKDIYRLFYEITRERLTLEATPYVEKYAHGGMSDGKVRGCFWIKQGIPFLMEEYHNWLSENQGTYFKEIPSTEVRYVVEKRADAYVLKLQKWDDGQGWNYQFPPGWGEYDCEIHLYSDADAAKRTGNFYLVTHAKCKKYEIHDRIIVWYWNDGESRADKLPVDNLLMYDNDYNEVWSMREFLNRKEMCTGVSIDGDKSFWFQTFCGVAYQIDIENLSEIKHMITK